MRIIRQEIPLSKYRELHLYPIGDIHFNSPLFLEDKFKEWMNIFLNDKYGKCVILGDIIDEDRPSTRAQRKQMFFDRPEAYEAEDEQHKFFIDNHIIPKFLSKLNKNNTIGIIDGDHHRLYVNGLTSSQYICSKLNIPYLGNGQAIISLVFVDKIKIHKVEYAIHIRHGIGFNSKQGGTLNKNIDFQEKIRGIDCFIRGHSHNAMLNSYTTYEFDNRALKLNDRFIWLLNVGSFRGGYSIESFDSTDRIVYKNNEITQVDYAETKEYGNTTKDQVMLNIKYVNTNAKGRHLVVKGSYI